MNNNAFRFVLLFTVAVLSFPSFVSGEDKIDSVTVQESRITFSYLCLSNDSIKLTANIFVKKEGDVFGLSNAIIEFYSGSDKQNLFLGKIRTDQDGTAESIVSVAGLRSGEDGKITYSARFNGSVEYSPCSAEFQAEPARIRLSFNIQDSVRFLNVAALKKDKKGKEIPLTRETVNIYVPRLFSLLKIGEISLDEQGKGNFEFPRDIVGDTLGNLRIIAKIEESDTYGFVQGQADINWGVPKQYYKAEVPSRELWTPIAPLWMVITLIIMLTGVWAHYIYAVWELVMIRKSGKKNKNPL